MKILYIITQADGGGAQNYTLALAKHFGGAIAAGSQAGKLFNDAKKAGMETFPLSHLKRAINPWHDFLAVWEIRQLVKLYKPDVIHLNSTKAGILGSFAAIGLKTKVIFTAHGFIFNEPLPFWLKSFYLALEKVASSYRDYIICVSDADHKSALDNKLISADKISTIHNGLEPINFLSESEAKATLGVDGSKIIIGCVVASFYKTKGVDVLIEAAAMLGQETKNRCQFIVIGGGEERKILEAAVKNHRLDNKIKFLGKIDQAKLYLKALDIFVMPSRKEGFPFALLEAMQAGLPIIATSVGGIPEALGDAGILVEPENPKKLSFAITTILLDSNIVASLSEKALERSKLFTAEKMLEETTKIYKKIV